MDGGGAQVIPPYTSPRSPAVRKPPQRSNMRIWTRTKFRLNTMRTSVKCVVGHKSGKCGRKRPAQQSQNTGEREAAWVFDFYTPDVLRSPAAAWLPLVQDGSVGLGTKVARGTELERKRLLGPHPPPRGAPQIQRRSKSGQNQVSTRFRPDFDPISTRFRPDFDPISTRRRFSTRF